MTKTFLTVYEVLLHKPSKDLFSYTWFPLGPFFHLDIGIWSYYKKSPIREKGLFLIGF